MESADLMLDGNAIGGLLGEGGPNHEAERIRIVTDEQADHAK